MKKIILVGFCSICFLLFTLFLASIAKAQDFEATFSGDFWVAGDVGRSVLFIVEESGDGYEDTFEGFNYTAYLLHNLARIPPGCGYMSSTGVDGFGVLTFIDGEIFLKRISGTACFSFPTIICEEQWKITSGTEAYVGASGKLSRHLEGDVTSGLASGTLIGTIRLR